MSKQRITDEEMIGRRYGLLIVTSAAEAKAYASGHRERYFNCLCDCGRTVSVAMSHLRTGHTKSCGCISSKNKDIIENPDILIGRRFGRLVVTGHFIENNKLRIKSICDCGNEHSSGLYSLLNGDCKSCGCYKSDITSEIHFQDLTGQQFGNWTVIKRAENRCKDLTYFTCRCICGTVKDVYSMTLKNGTSTGCGCIKKSSTGDIEIETFLQNHNIEYKKEYSFPDLKYKNRLRFDFGIMRNGSLLCLIEVQGIQHYVDTGTIGIGKQQREITDPMKKEYCAKHNIPLYEIRYDEDKLKKINDISMKYMLIPCQAQETVKV